MTEHQRIDWRSSVFSYNSGKFAPLSDSELGQKLWAFLAQPENFARIETVSELSKPTVEEIEEQVLEAFREEMLVDRMKQMTGRMVR